MPRNLRVVVAILILTVAAQARAEPGVELTDGGRTILYRARPGDAPSAVARALGIPAAQVDALLAAKDIRDGGHVPVGFEYRVPNPLAARADAAETRSAELEQRAAAAEDALASVQRTEELRGEERRRLAQLEGRWSLALWALVGLAAGLAVTGAVAAAALRRERGATRYARTMAQELEDKRRAGLAERQQSARRIVELEDRLRQLERRAHAVPRSA
jgi:hypothetical protein